MTRRRATISSDEFSSIVGKPYKDILGVPVEGGWCAFVEGRRIDQGVSSRSVLVGNAFVEDFMDPRSQGGISPQRVACLVAISWLDLKDDRSSEITYSSL